MRRTGLHCTSDRFYTKEELEDLFPRAGFEIAHSSFWGGVPAGIGERMARLLAWSELIAEKIMLDRLLGGLTFAYRVAD